MIAILIAFLYITTLSWVWGRILYKGVTYISGQQLYLKDLILTCLCGIAFIGIILNILSLFIPISGVLVHLLIISPSFLWAIINSRELGAFKHQIKELFNTLHISGSALMISCIGLILIMGVHTIAHPDSLHYHIPCIKWLQSYGIIPGIGNLDYHLGLQSSWFPLCAFFSFDFLHLQSLTFINNTIAIWFVMFVISNIFRSRHTFIGISWLMLLIASLGSYTMIRLTVTSASPDFVATLYILLVIYLLSEHSQSKQNSNLSFSLLLVILGFFTLTIKLSSILILIPVIIVYYSKNVFYKWWLPIITGLVIIGPLIIRNYVSTGYPLFPTSYLSFISPDWKMPPDLIEITQRYITTYARVTSGMDSAAVNASIRMNMIEWTPIWWRIQSIADKTVLSGLGLAIILLAIVVIKKKQKIDSSSAIILFTTVAGLILWFLTAPDPRFGAGYIIGLEGISIYLFINSFLDNNKTARIYLSMSSYLFSIVIVSYCVYRVLNYMEPKNLISPSGVVFTPYKTIKIDSINFNVPLRVNCGETPIPCIDIDVDHQFILRGKDLRDGFKPRY